MLFVYHLMFVGHQILVMGMLMCTVMRGLSTQHNAGYVYIVTHFGPSSYGEEMVNCSS
jgi:hypothetical protein